MGLAQQVAIVMTDMECGKCGIVFSVPETFRAEKQHDGGTWYCPNGHPRVYRETDADRYKRLWEDEQKRRSAALARANEAEAERAKAEAALKRHKSRTKNGICPCCNRTFSQLARHMKAKHPDYAAG